MPDDIAQPLAHHGKSAIEGEMGNAKSDQSEGGKKRLFLLTQRETMGFGLGWHRRRHRDWRCQTV
jgi:hypothetical protein